MSLLRLAAAFLALYVSHVQSDGTGLIGWGKTMYHPTCAFACRVILKDSRLACTPEDVSENHGTHHSPVTTPPECFMTDPIFLRTAALCIDTYCSISDQPSLDLIESYWAGHLGTGTVGTDEYRPAISFQDALVAAREDEANYVLSKDTAAAEMDHSGHAGMKAKRHGGMAMDIPEAIGPEVSSPLPMLVDGDPLNETSFVNPEDWQINYNGLKDFETNEAGHSTYTLIITFIAILFPIALSTLRFIPGFSSSGTVSFVKSTIITPAVWGQKHRQPVAPYAGGLLLPTRGQALYIALISFLNVIFLIAPYVHTHPQATFSSGSAEQSVSTIGNRAGVMAMGNAAAMFLFATRNNILLFLTDWSHGTYILLHRMLGYWTVFHTVLHSVMLLAYYDKYGTYAEEIVRVYWQWGIVATVAIVAILPLSLLVVRQKAYELFKASHVGLSVLFIVGYYYHIWYCYGFRWGYEIFAYVVGGIWALEHVIRIVRLAMNGVRTAVVTPVDGTGDEYVRIEIEGVTLHGTAYLTFPTLSWQFWGSHPFSVAYNRDGKGLLTPVTPTTPSEKTLEEGIGDNETAPTKRASTTVTTALPQTATGKKSSVFFSRTRTGVTALLRARAATAGPAGLRVKVLVDGSYHSNASAQIHSCAALLCIGGGIGITALLPLLQHFAHPERAHLQWGTRKRDLIDALEPETARLSASGVEVATTVGQRLDLESILLKELVWAEASEGKLGLVVCGPAGMADDVRAIVARLGRDGKVRRGVVFVDEAFSW